MASHCDDRTHPCKQGKGRLKYEHCGKLGHKIDKCYTLHRRPPRFAVVVQIDLSPPSSVGNPPSFVSFDTPAMFNKFLKWHKNQQSYSSTAFVAHTCMSFASLTQSSSPGSWVFDSGATDHITSNKSLFSSLSFLNPLTSIILTDGSKVSFHGVGIAKLFPSLTIDNVLYIPKSPFILLCISRITHSLDCVVSFTNNFVCLQDRSLK